MKTPLLLALALGLFVLAPAVQADSNINQPPLAEAAPQFVPIIDDLPLMPGLTPVEDKNVLFIARSGRIAQTTASGPVDVDTVYHFYQQSLPQLGWRMINARTYERDGERLRLDVSGVTPNATTVVRFAVEPVGKKKR